MTEDAQSSVFSSSFKMSMVVMGWLWVLRMPGSGDWMFNTQLPFSGAFFLGSTKSPWVCLPTTYVPQWILSDSQGWYISYLNALKRLLWIFCPNPPLGNCLTKVSFRHFQKQWMMMLSHSESHRPVSRTYIVVLYGKFFSACFYFNLL